MCAVELGFPILVEPACAERIGHRGQEGHVFAPARLAAQADAIDFVVFVGHRCGGFFDVAPCWRVGHFHPGIGHKVLAIHHHRAFAIKRRGVKFAVNGQAATDGGKDIVRVPIGRQIVQRNQPVLSAPDRDLVGADGHDVELTALGGDVLGHTLAQNVFFQRDPFQFDVRVLGGEIVGQTLHTDHVAVVHCCDGDCGFGVDCGGRKNGCRTRQREWRPEKHPLSSLMHWMLQASLENTTTRRQ